MGKSTLLLQVKSYFKHWRMYFWMNNINSKTEQVQFTSHKLELTFNLMFSTEDCCDNSRSRSSW